MNALEVLAFAQAEDERVVPEGAQGPSSTAIERTERNGVVTYHFEHAHEHLSLETDICFEIGQVVVFAAGTPESVKEEFGRVLLVVDDDTDLIVQFEVEAKKNRDTASVPQSDEELYVTCYSLAKPVRRLQVSREALVKTGGKLSIAEVHELLIEWTGKGLVGDLKPHWPSPEFVVV